jgi:hypothetical protein
LSELDHPIVVDFPLRGDWTVEQTPAHRIPSHGTDVLGMRYAYDFIRTDDRQRSRVHPAGSLRWFLVGGRTRDCYGWVNPSTRHRVAKWSTPSTECPSANGCIP